MATGFFFSARRGALTQKLAMPSSGIVLALGVGTVLLYAVALIRLDAGRTDDARWYAQASEPGPWMMVCRQLMFAASFVVALPDTGPRSAPPWVEACCCVGR